MYDRRAYDLSQLISKIDAEFAIRRTIKEARDKQRQARDAERVRQRAANVARTPVASADLTEGALARWFSQMSMQPQGVRTLLVEFAWELQGRRYSATYTLADCKLAVWVQVKPGTPDAISKGDGHFMPANNRREFGRALDAEKRAGRR
jgi:hypothetical protein